MFTLRELIIMSEFLKESQGMTALSLSMRIEEYVENAKLTEGSLTMFVEVEREYI